jgi:hypothetical protein
MTIARTGGERGELTIEGNSSRAVIDGGPEIDSRAWQKSYESKRRSMRTRSNWKNGEDVVFNAMLEDQPSLTISAPRGTSVRIENSAVRLMAEGDTKRLEVEDNTHIVARFGDIDEADIAVHGRGYLAMGDVAQVLDATVHGAGDIVFKNAGEADLTVHGAGDIEGRTVRGDLEAEVHGAGDIELASILGSADINIHGAGDIEIEAIRGPLDASIHGSGDMVVGEAMGTIDASVNGSGDLSINGGTADRLVASVRGSGNFTFGGTAGEAQLTSQGSGGINVARVDGTFRVSGNNITVGSNDR